MMILNVENLMNSTLSTVRANETPSICILCARHILFRLFEFNLYGGGDRDREQDRIENKNANDYEPNTLTQFNDLSSISLNSTNVFSR